MKPSRANVPWNVQFAHILEKMFLWIGIRHPKIQSILLHLFSTSDDTDVDFRQMEVPADISC